MRVGGLVLTGGSSRRFGVAKATLLLDGQRLADRVLGELEAVASPVVEVGPSYTSAPSVREDPPGTGPLAAIVAGWSALRAADDTIDAGLVLAVDLPFADRGLLEWLAQHPAPGSVVPIVDERAQPLCARYDAAAFATASDLVARGERSMHALLDAIDVHEARSDEWSAVADARAFADVDTPDDAAALGVEAPR